MSGAPPFLSVVMPTHDGGDWLARAFDSLALQDERGFECLVVDSSPNDATLALAARYADRLTIRTFKRPDLGHWRSKTNFGFAEARATHVAMLHQDDLWLPGRAAAARRWIEAAPEPAMHVHAARVIDAQGRALGTWRCPLPAKTPAPRETVLRRLLVQNFIAVPTCVIRRDALLSVGGIDESLWYTGDWDLYLKLARAGDVAYHRDVLACFRVHGRSLTMSGSAQPRDFEDQMRQVLDKHASALNTPALRRAQASIAVNAGLARANNGDRRGIGSALGALARLGPLEAARYLFESRLIERVAPRLRARLAGAF